MRFFTFFVTACATVISINAIGTEDVKGNGKCYTAMEDSVKGILASKSKLDSSSLDPIDDATAEAVIKIIQNEKSNLVAGFKSVSLICCEALTADSVDNETLNRIAKLIDTYSDYLLNFKSKKPSLTKNPKVLGVVKDFFDTTFSNLENFIRCADTIIMSSGNQVAFRDLGLILIHEKNNIDDYYFKA